MKKLLCLLTVFCLCAFFAACKDDNKTNTQSDESVAEESIASYDSNVNGDINSSSSDVSGEISIPLPPVGTDDSSGQVDIFTHGDYDYTVVNTVAMVYAYNGSEKEVVVPAELDGYAVTAIVDKAFAGNTKIKSLTVGDTVVKVGENAFDGCTALEKVSIGNSVAVLPVSAFNGCSSLKKIEISTANAAFLSASGMLYNKDKTTLLRCPIAVEQSSITLPATVTLVGEGAFADCVGVKSVKLSDGCALASKAFFHCMDLEKITFGKGLTEIPQKCFFGCVMLGTVTVPEGVTAIGDYAFYGCVRVKNASLPASVTEIGQDVFKDCSALKKISYKGDYCKTWYDQVGKTYINA